MLMAFAAVWAVAVLIGVPIAVIICLVIFVSTAIHDLIYSYMLKRWIESDCQDDSWRP